MFLENESKLCECRVNLFFLADKSTPTCLFLHTDYHYPYDFMSPECRYMRFLYFYCRVLWLLLFVNFWRFDQFYVMFSPDDKKRKKTNKNAESMDRFRKFEGVVSQKLDGTWLFMEYVYLMFSSLNTLHWL